MLEEYGPKIVFIKGIHNTVADAVSWLEYDPSVNQTAESFHTMKVRNNSHPSQCWMTVSKKWCKLDIDSDNLDSYTNKRNNWNLVFAHHKEEDKIYPLTLTKIADAQHKDRELKAYFKEKAKMTQKDICLHLIEDTKVLCKNGKLMIPAWAIHSTYHTVLKASPGAAIFGQDMLFDIPFIADLQKIGEHRQKLTDLNNARENEGRFDYYYKVGQKVLLRKDGIFRNAESRWHKKPRLITSVHTNGTITVQCRNKIDRINIQRVKPFEEDLDNE